MEGSKIALGMLLVMLFGFREVEEYVEVMGSLKIEYQ